MCVGRRHWRVYDGVACGSDVMRTGLWDGEVEDSGWSGVGVSKRERRDDS